MAAEPDETTGRRGRSLTDQAYAVLRERIITGELAPGAEVSEPELAEQLSVSKTPVREALARLCLEGLMEAFPRRGYRVTPITVKDMNDLFQVRAALEGSAAALAARIVTPADLDRLDQLADTQYIIGENASTHTFVKANETFHVAIARASGNPRLHAMIAGLLDECARLFYLGAHVRDVNPETTADHHRIVAALRAGDAEAARTIMVAHNENTRRGLLSAMISEGHRGISL